jgi:DNA invertase Pin-like site-specific DNA recombinase
MKTCYIYTRTASQHPLGDNTYHSIEIQKSLCLDYAEKHTYKVLGSFQDNGISGNVLKRKGLQQLLKKSGKYPVDAVLVSRIDRLSRNIIIFNQINKELLGKGLELISVAEGKLNTPRKMLTVTVSISPWNSERDKLK